MYRSDTFLLGVSAFNMHASIRRRMMAMVRLCLFIAGGLSGSLVLSGGLA